MKAYLAILKDSFREAIVSKALWGMLALIAILLIVCACFGYRERVRTKFDNGDINDARVLAYRMLNDEDERIVHFRSLVDADKLARLKELTQPPKDEEQRDRGDVFRAMATVREVLNDLVQDEETYREEIWKRYTASTELTELLEKGELEDRELQRRNRLILESTFRDQVVVQPQRRVAITFAMFETPDPLPMTKSRLDDVIKTFIVPVILSIVVGTVGILFAVGITSPIIPRMYEQGALHLLLSKPVSRSLVFVTKFFGGCAFILLYISLLLTGLYVILGVRFGIWNTGLLWCIPVFVFSFAIFYSVSALSGAIWKNAIVALAMTALFWLICTTVGATHAIMKQLVDQKRIVQLSGDGDITWAMRDNGAMTVWEPTTGSWQDFGGAMGGQAWLGPIYDKQNDRVLSAAGRSAPFMPMAPRYQLYSTSEADGWARKSLVGLPTGTVDLFSLPDGRSVVVTADGVLAINDRESSEVTADGDGPAESPAGSEQDTSETTPESNSSEPEPQEEQEEKKGGFFGLQLPSFFSRDSGPLQSIGPEERLRLSFPTRAALTPGGNIVLIDSTRLVELRLDADQQFKVHRDVEFSMPPSAADEASEPLPEIPGLGLLNSSVPFYVRATDKHLLLGTKTGEAYLYSMDDLKLKKKFQPLNWNDEPRFVTTSPNDERFYILNHGQTIQIVDADEETLYEPRWPHQEEISAFRLEEDGKKASYVSTGGRFTVLDLETGKTELERVPEVETWVWFYRSILSPVYRVFPRPGDLEQTVQYLTSEKTSIGVAADDLMGASRTTIDPWDPIRANLIFIVFMLVVSCIYIERQEL